MMEREGESRSNCAILLFSDESKPTIEKGLEDVILDAVGLEARFDCSVLHGVGHEDTVEWLKNSRHLVASDNCEVLSDNGKHALIIKCCRIDDIGSYSVKVGDLTSAASLSIKGQFHSVEFNPDAC